MYQNLKFKADSYPQNSFRLLSCHLKPNTKYQLTKLVLSNKKEREHKNEVQHKLFNIPSNMGFLAFFYVTGKHVGDKSSMQGECVSFICNIFQV